MTDKPTYEELEQRVKELEKENVEYKQIEETLRESEERYRNVYSTAPLAFVIWDRELRVTDWNEGAEKIFGWSREEVLKRNFFKFLIPDGARPHVEDIVDRLLQGELPSHSINENLTKRGEIVLIEWNNSILYDNLGHVVGAISLGLDITDRKQAEEQLIKAKEVAEAANLALRKERDLFQRYLSLVEAIIVILDPNGIITMLNRKGCELLGYKEEEILGENWFKKCLPQPEGWEDVYSVFKDIMKGNLAAAEYFENEIISKDGQKRLIAWRNNFFRNESGQIIGTISAGEDITERKQAEKALRKSEAQLSNAMKMAKLGHWELDVDSGMFTFTDSFYAIFRTTAEKEGGYQMSITDYAKRFVHPESFQLVAEETRKALETDDPNFSRYLEHRMLYSDGSVGHIAVRFFIVKDDKGNTIKTFGVNQDITERKLAEESLRSSEEKFSKAFQANPSLMAIRSLKDGRFINVNDSYCRVTGYSRDELIGRDSRELEITDPETVAKVYEIIKKQAFLRDWEGTFKTKKGDVRTGLFSAVTVEIGNEPCLLSALIDITDRQRAHQVLRDNEELLTRLIAAIPDPVVRTDINGKIQFVNDIALQVSGYERSEFIGKSMFFFIAPEDHEKAKRNTRLMMEQRIGPVEYQLIMKGGAIRHFEVNGDVLRAGDGVPYNLVYVLRDVTERKRTEEEKTKLESQLVQAQKMEAIGTLAGGIAHDFNNLLMGIQGRASLILADSDSYDPYYEHLKGIEDYVKSASDLTKQLLAFATGGKYEVKPTDLNQLLDKNSEMFGRTKKEITIHRKRQKAIWTAEVDRSQIEQVLLNLFVNAWQSMPSGGKLYLETENVMLDSDYVKPYSVEPGKYVKISVTDTGVGMDNVTKGRIFDPFFTTKEMGRGTGLGLASAYGIIKNHNGFINVYSEKGKGTTFNLYLPASEKEVIDEKELSEEVLKGGETVLLVDDEDMIVDVSKELLKKMGYKVLVAKGGKSAIELYAANRNEIDIVILDMIMPDMGGGETYDKLKEINPYLKVLLSSGYSINGQATEILERGCNGFIQKPFNMIGLSHKIREILDKD